ncbi:tetratricopeptide repeat protein [Parablastomonas sp. CN1-191]|uniref:tetratricopeptide repeat protein n=1 Tax=Parablastomonas sp. CN1-191 TaxID=3400908 RepID=UPI003BF8EA6E
MRYTPAALCLSLIAMVSASGTFGAAPAEPLDPRARALIAQGEAAESAGQVDAAVDAFEAALAIQPGSVAVLVTLADATRRQGMQGKALHYYREALEREPDNQAAIAGEGAALVEKGAVEKARRNLARLQQLCGGSCPPAQSLAAAISKGPTPQVVTADQVKSQPVVTSN